MSTRAVAWLLAAALVGAGACDSDPAAPSNPLPDPPPPSEPPPDDEPAADSVVDPCPSDLAPASRSPEGYWHGWSEGVSFLVELGAPEGDSLTGQGRMVGMPWTVNVRGEMRADSLRGVIDVRERLNREFEFSGRVGDDLVCGLVNGVMHQRLEFRDSPLSLRRLPPEHPAIAGREWELVTPTPSPDSLIALRVRGNLWVVVALGGGLLVSRDAGETWERPLEGFVTDATFHPTDPERILAVQGNALQLSTDAGRSWDERATFSEGGAAVHVSDDGTIWYAPGWPPGSVPGLYRSDGWEGPFHFLPYGGWDGEMIITWDIAEAPWSGTLFLSNEIADHPQPYDPPYLRSDDRGQSWTDESDPWIWHSYATGIDAHARRVYNLLEGPGLWISEDDGLEWELWSRVRGLALHVEPDRNEVWIGQLPLGLLRGGAYLSRDGGRLFEPAGLVGRRVSSFARDVDGRLLATSVGQGIMRLRSP